MMGCDIIGKNIRKIPVKREKSKIPQAVDFWILCTIFFEFS